ncbi:DUF2793 domain-containing protein [Aurantiacibacter spongiae]|uniref:DUF2793 domain-containing protein n=1 Tax=Aurantiacibacter spongiae TaxID=2488860 RepID=UPI001F2EE1E7|nr:DUF2793 domain-containing protein [Aurantiacibacter spongiae]
MTDPVTYQSATARHALPNLFAGQAQKEFTVNEALALIDALLHPVIEGEADTPPTSPENGECWLVGAGATGAWIGRDGRIACRQAGTWLFAAPVTGMTVLDLQSLQLMRFDGDWRRAVRPPRACGRSGRRRGGANGDRRTDRGPRRGWRHSARMTDPLRP